MRNILHGAQVDPRRASPAIAPYHGFRGLALPPRLQQVVLKVGESCISARFFRSLRLRLYRNIIGLAYTRPNGMQSS